MLGGNLWQHFQSQERSTSQTITPRPLPRPYFIYVIVPRTSIQPRHPLLHSAPLRSFFTDTHSLSPTISHNTSEKTETPTIAHQP